MTFWIIQLVVFLGYSLFLHLVGKDDKIWWISLVHFAFLAMCRSETVGTDTNAYCLYYSEARRVTSLKELLSSQMAGLYLFTQPFRFFFPNGSMWMVLSGFIQTVGVWVFIKRNSDNRFLSIFLYLTCYFYFQGMNAGRQAMAMSFAFMAIDSIFRKRYMMSIPFTALALLVHPGGTIVILLFYGLSVIRWSFKRYMILVVLDLAFMLFVSSFFSTVQRIFTSIFRYYGRYSYDAWQSNGRMTYFYAFILIYVFFGVMAVHKAIDTPNSELIPINDAKKCERNKQVFYITTSAVTIQLILCITLSGYVFITRVTNLIFYLIIVLIPQIWSIRNKHAVVMNTILIIGTIGYLFLRLKGNYSGVIPYRFVF